jgi:hypothetical protein
MLKGYIDITSLEGFDMRDFTAYLRNLQVKRFLVIASVETGVRKLFYVQSRKGGEQSVWVHPIVAVHFLSCISPYYFAKVCSWTLDAERLETEEHIGMLRKELFVMRRQNVDYTETSSWCTLL